MPSVHCENERYKNPQHGCAVISLATFTLTICTSTGTVAWSVKGVFNAYIGWFSGDPVDLSPLTPNEMANNVVTLAGGADNVAQRAEDALQKKEYQWALTVSLSLCRLNFIVRSLKMVVG